MASSGKSFPLGCLRRYCEELGLGLEETVLDRSSLWHAFHSDYFGHWVAVEEEMGLEPGVCCSQVCTSSLEACEILFHSTSASCFRSQQELPL